MDSLVLELQRDALQPQTKVTDLLRKALVVARKLGVSEFQKWITEELNGYTVSKDVPTYRIIGGELRAWNPVHGWRPVLVENPDTAEMLTNRPIVQSISELESLAAGDRGGGHLLMAFPTNVEAKLMRAMGSPYPPKLHFGRSQIDGIIDAVRNTVLNLALQLEEQGILGEDMAFSEPEKERAQRATSINIQSFQGILGDVRESTVYQETQITVQQGDFRSLVEYVKSIGLTDEDAADLQVVIEEQDKPPSRDNLGPKIAAWIGRMVTKAASGAWRITAGTAAGLLSRAIAAYYGL